MILRRDEFPALLSNLSTIYRFPSTPLTIESQLENLAAVPCPFTKPDPPEASPAKVVTTPVGSSTLRIQLFVESATYRCPSAPKATDLIRNLAAAPVPFVKPAVALSPATKVITPAGVTFEIAFPS